MNFSAPSGSLSKIAVDLLVIRLFEAEQKFEPAVNELDAALQGMISRLVQAGDFKGKLGETALLFTDQKIPARRVLLVGLGKKSEYDLEKLRAAISALSPFMQKLRVRHLALGLGKALPRGASLEEANQAMTESLLLSIYKFNHYKRANGDEQPVSLERVQFVLNNAGRRQRVLAAAREGELLAQTVNFVRDLGNHPANVATPTHLASHALKIAKADRRIRVKILHRKDIKKEKMRGLLAVSQGSDEEPKFIVLEYRPRKNAPVIALVGKGITFDSGGISIKPSDKMEEMKYDMAGAATVMGIIKVASALKLPVNLVGLIPATENLPSGKASKPGDIVRSRSGKTIEIVNTDAEGRLVLADALDYAKKYRPALIMDFATLTGAIVVALGDDLIGTFANRENLLPKLRSAAEKTGEKIWPMPLEKDYEQFIKSDFADLRNIGTTRYGDSINAANFLKEFVGDTPWIHLDIAGVAWTTREKPYRPKGATGTGVRLAIEFLKKFRK